MELKDRCTQLGIKLSDAKNFVMSRNLLTFTLLIAAVGFTAVSIQQSCERRAVVRVNEQLSDIERQTDTTTAQTTAILEAFEKSHKTTDAILETVRVMGENYKQISDLDRRQSEQIEKLSKKNYEDARQPHSAAIQSKPVKKRVYRTDADFQRRADELLADDRKLYDSNSQ